MIEGLKQTVFILVWGSDKEVQQLRYFGATQLVDASTAFASHLVRLKADDAVNAAYVTLSRVWESEAQPGGTLVAWTKMDKGYAYSEGETTTDKFKQ